MSTCEELLQRAVARVVSEIGPESGGDACRRGPAALRALCLRSAADDLAAWPPADRRTACAGPATSIAAAEWLHRVADAVCEELSSRHGPVVAAATPAGIDIGAVTLNETRCDAPTDLDGPSQMPRSARFVLEFEYAYGPAHSWADRFAISTNRSRTLWILWHAFGEDEYFGPGPEWLPSCWIASRGVDRRRAAAGLLYAHLKHWKKDRPHFVSRCGVVDADMATVLFDEVWPEDREAAGVPVPLDVFMETLVRLRTWSSDGSE